MERFTIWSNFDVDEGSYEANLELLQDECTNLDIELGETIIVVGDLGLWNGRVTGYKLIESSNLKDCFQQDTDFTEWFVDKEGELRAIAAHHDGTNYYLYRVFKEGLSDEQKEKLLQRIARGQDFKELLEKYTNPLGTKVAEVYGWRCA